MFYLLLKFLHIACVVIFVGNITTGAFWAAHARKSRDFRLIASTGRSRCRMRFVAPRQREIARLAHAAQSGDASWNDYEKAYKDWFFRGLVASIAPIAAMPVMVFKPVLPAF